MDVNGWVLVYLSNESGIDVHFDNLNLQHYKGTLLEESHYYPYGLTITKQATTQASGNRVLFTSCYHNREEFANKKGLGWSDMGARQYDPQIGRWHSADPLAEGAANWSPYRYAFSNPVVYSDPSGMFEDDGEGEYNVWDEEDDFSTHSWGQWTEWQNGDNSMETRFEQGVEVFYSPDLMATMDVEGSFEGDGTGDGDGDGDGKSSRTAGSVAETVGNGLRSAYDYLNNNSFWNSGTAIYRFSNWFNYNISPLYIGGNGVYESITGRDYLSGNR